jgi:hypothetical protein
MSRSILRPRTIRPLAVTVALGAALAVLAPSTFVPEAAAQFSFGASRMSGGQDRMPRGSGVSGGTLWTRAPIRLGPIPLGPRYDEPVYDEEVERPVRRPRRTEIVDDEPSPRRPHRRVRPKKQASPEAKPFRRAAKTAAPARREAVRPGRPKPPLARARPAPSRPPALLAAEETRRVPDEVLFEVRERAGTRGAAEIARRHRLVPIASQPLGLLGSTIHRYRIADRRRVAEVVSALERDARVATVQPNFIFRLEAEAARSALAGAQYAIAKMRIPEAHRVATGREVVVAVIDSGVDRSHPELSKAVSDGFDAVGGRASAHAHGTGIAGIIGASAQLTGVAPGARLLAVRAFTGEPGKPGAQGTTFHVLRAIDWAHQHAARVVNMSFAGPRDPLLSRTLRAGRDKGMVFVAAVGNEGPDAKPLYPAADESVIAVTASDKADHVYASANRGAYICVTAPGVDILTPVPGGAYDFSSGTSLAAAHVSGAVALLLQGRPSLTPEEVRAILVRSARDLGGPGADSEFGAGFADALAIVGSGADENKQAAAEVVLSPAAQPIAPDGEAGSSTR